MTGSTLGGRYTLRHDDPGWPADLDRTISTHHHIDDALAALDDVLAQRDAQLAANGEGAAGLHLAVVDDTGRPLATADVHGHPTRDRWPL